MVFVDGGPASIRDCRWALRLSREGGVGDTIELYSRLVVGGLVMRQSVYGVVLVHRGGTRDSGRWYVYYRRTKQPSGARVRQGNISVSSRGRWKVARNTRNLLWGSGLVTTERTRNRRLRARVRTIGCGRGRERGTRGEAEGSEARKRGCYVDEVAAADQCSTSRRRYKGKW